MASLPPLGKPEDQFSVPPTKGMKLTLKEEALMEKVKQYKSEQYKDKQTDNIKIVVDSANGISPVRIKEMAKELHSSDISASVLLLKVASRLEKEAKQNAVAQPSIEHHDETVKSSPTSSPTLTKLPNKAETTKADSFAHTILPTSEAPAKTASTPESIKKDDEGERLNETQRAFLARGKDNELIDSEVGAVKLIEELYEQGYTASIVWKDTYEQMHISGYLPKQFSNDSLTIHHENITLEDLEKACYPESRYNLITLPTSGTVMHQIINNEEIVDLCGKFDKLMKNCLIEPLTNEEALKFCQEKLTGTDGTILWKDLKKGDCYVTVKNRTLKVDDPAVKRAFANPGYIGFTLRTTVYGNLQILPPMAPITKNQYENLKALKTLEKYAVPLSEKEALLAVNKLKATFIWQSKDDGKFYISYKSEGGILVEREVDEQVRKELAELPSSQKMIVVGSRQIPRPMTKEEYGIQFKNLVLEGDIRKAKFLEQYSVSEKDCTEDEVKSFVNEKVTTVIFKKGDKYYLVFPHSGIGKYEWSDDMMRQMHNGLGELSIEADRLHLWTYKKPPKKDEFLKQLKKIRTERQEIYNSLNQKYAILNEKKLNLAIEAKLIHDLDVYLYDSKDGKLYICYNNLRGNQKVVVDKDIKKALLNKMSDHITLPDKDKTVIQKPLLKDFDAKFKGVLESHKVEAPVHDEEKKDELDMDALPDETPSPNGLIMRPIVKDEFKKIQGLEDYTILSEVEAKSAVRILKDKTYLRYDPKADKLYISYMVGPKREELLVEEAIRTSLLLKDKDKTITLPGNGARIPKPILKTEFLEGLKADTHEAEVDPYFEFIKKYCVVIGRDCTQEEFEKFVRSDTFKQDNASVVIKKGSEYFFVGVGAEIPLDFGELVPQMASKADIISVPFPKSVDEDSRYFNVAQKPYTIKEFKEKLKA